MIHSLGMEFAPVDESLNCSAESWNKHLIEPVPTSALRR